MITREILSSVSPVISKQYNLGRTIVSCFENQTIALGKLLRYVEAIANIIYKGIAFGSFFSDVLQRQTENF